MCSMFCVATVHYTLSQPQDKILLSLYRRLVDGHVVLDLGNSALDGASVADAEVGVDI